MNTARAGSWLRIALDAVRQRGDELRRMLDTLPVPVYVTSSDGIVTNYNRACIAFTGRTPQVGRDRWCVTWRLHTEKGEFLPHDQCPMAIAIRERGPVRGVGAVAERPDGSRARFLAYPTPWFDEAGNLMGAVNMFIEMTHAKQVGSLREQATRCRRLAGNVSDERTINILRSMADEYEARAQEIEAANQPYRE